MSVKESIEGGREEGREGRRQHKSGLRLFTVFVLHGHQIEIVNIWERAKARRHLEHYLDGEGVNCYDALMNEKN